MNKDLLLNVKVWECDSDSYVRIEVRPSLLSDEKDLAKAIYTMKQKNIDLNDWEITNRAKKMGFESVQEMLKESTRILKEIIPEDFNGHRYYLASELFGKKILLEKE